MRLGDNMVETNANSVGFALLDRNVVEHILGETERPKVSERLEPYPPAPEPTHAEGKIKPDWHGAIE